ncbi:MAG: Qat anti-phage system associated protein QatB [Patescibacteria group bacterium]|jgi:hypothetical protein
MGTSASYSGPTGTNPLLPPWAEEVANSDNNDSNHDEVGKDDNESRQESQPVSDLSGYESWTNVKSRFTAYANSSTRSNFAARRIARTFVSAQGGSKGASGISRRGRSTAQNLGGVLSGFAKSGENLAYNGVDFKDYVGKKASEILSVLVDLVAPDNDDIESSIARNASIEALSKLFEIYDVDSKGLDALRNMSSDDMKVVFETYLSEYIFSSLLNKAGQHLNNMSDKEADKCEKQVKSYIYSKVRLDISNTNLERINWKNVEGQSFVKNIFEIAYRMVQV